MERIEKQDEASLTGFDSFIDKLYDQGDPSRIGEEGGEPQTPLFDSLKSTDTRYVDQKLIAEGGMKEVYLVYDRRASRQVALAKPLRKLGRDYYDSFLREAHLTARLEHPCIINLFGMGVDEEERPFFTMEYKRGRSLKKILSDLQDGKGSESWPLVRRLGVLQRVCEGVSYAHSRRVLHLDLKPGNIQVGSFGEVQICDWGLGVVMQAEEDRMSEVLLDPDLYGSLHRTVRGTTYYMAPELYDPRMPKTPQMDIYALGCIMEELVAPLKTSSSEGTISEVDYALEAMVQKAKAKAPEERYTSVEEMLLDLERFIGGFRTSVEKKTVRRELALFYRRHRQIANIVLLCLLLLVVATSAFIANLRSSRNAANAARIVAEKAMKKAVEAQEDEEEARMHAVQALEELQIEKQISENRLQRKANLAWKDSHVLIELYFKNDVGLADFIDSMFEEIEAVTADNPSPENYVWNHKFWMYFLTQQFSRAVEIEESGKVVAPDLLPLARSFAKLSKNGNALADEDFLLLLKELGSPVLSDRGALAERMVEYDLRNHRSDKSRATLVKQLLTSANPGWDPSDFNYEPENCSLKIGGDEFVRLTNVEVNSNPSRCLIRFLDPKRLDLRGTGIRSLNEIQNLRLMELDIQGVPIQSVEPLKEMRSLRRLVVSSDQEILEYAKSLPSFIEVVVK